MIGFDLSIKVYYTPLEGKNKIEKLIGKINQNLSISKTCKSKKNFKTQEEEMDYFLLNKWNKKKYVKIIVQLMDISYLFTSLDQKIGSMDRRGS